jgi:hypothetical protein
VPDSGEDDSDSAQVAKTILERFPDQAAQPDARGATQRAQLLKPGLLGHLSVCWDDGTRLTV